jgi:hypothetical protein
MNADHSKFIIKNTQMVLKSGEKVEVLKYFKFFINKEYEVEYVCLLKINESNINLAKKTEAAIGARVSESSSLSSSHPTSYGDND